MINKEHSKDDSKLETIKESGYIDVVNIDVQCHLLIKNKDTNEVLVNKRG